MKKSSHLSISQNVRCRLFACKEKEEKRAIFLLALSDVQCPQLAKLLIVCILKSSRNFASK
jgi:hypothetical protein